MSGVDTSMERAIVLVSLRAKTVATAVPVPSPCISICRMSVQTGLCEGCFRSRAELGAWSSASDERKREIWAVIEQRMAALQA